MNLYHVQDDDRPMHVVAADFGDAVKRWQEQIRAENEDARLTYSGIPNCGSVMTDDDDDDDVTPQGVTLLAEGSNRADYPELLLLAEPLAPPAPAVPAAPQGEKASPIDLVRACRTRSDYDLRCQDCGAPHWIDTSLPSETWNKIAAPSDLLCMLCIDERLQRVGLSAAAEFYYSGHSLTGKTYTPSYGDLAWSRREVADMTEKLAAMEAQLRAPVVPQARYEGRETIDGFPVQNYPVSPQAAQGDEPDVFEAVAREGCCARGQDHIVQALAALLRERFGPIVKALGLIECSRQMCGNDPREGHIPGCAYNIARVALASLSSRAVPKLGATDA